MKQNKCSLAVSVTQSDTSTLLRPLRPLQDDDPLNVNPFLSDVPAQVPGTQDPNLNPNQGQEVLDRLTHSMAANDAKRIAKMVERTPFLSRLMKEATEIIPELPEKEFANEVSVIQTYKGLRNKANAKAKDLVNSVVRNLGSVEQSTLFNQYILLLDLQRDIEAGNYTDKFGNVNLPSQFKEAFPSEDEVKNALAAIKGKMQVDAGLQKAVASHERQFRAVVQEAVDWGVLPKHVLEDYRYLHHLVLSHLESEMDPRLNEDSEGSSARKTAHPFKEKVAGASRARSFLPGIVYNTDYITSMYVVSSSLITRTWESQLRNKLRSFADSSIKSFKDAEESLIEQTKDLDQSLQIGRAHV